MPATSLSDGIFVRMVLWVQAILRVTKFVLGWWHKLTDEMYRNLLDFETLQNIEANCFAHIF
jgi:hypothetical protein